MTVRKGAYNRFRGQVTKGIVDFVPFGIFSSTRQQGPWLPRITPDVIGQNEHTKRPAIYRKDL